MCSPAAGLVVAFAVTVPFSQTDRTKYKFSGGDQVTGQPKPLFETFASGDLADIIAYKFAKLSRNLKKYC